MWSIVEDGFAFRSIRYVRMRVWPGAPKRQTRSVAPYSIAMRLPSE